MNKFYIDKFINREVSYLKLIQDLNNLQLKKYVYYRDSYMVFLSIVKALAYGKEIVLLDGDWSQQELLNQELSTINIENEVYEIDINIENIDALYSLIEENRGDFVINLFTSGTTAKPKRIRHKYTSAARAVRYGDRYARDIWLFTYNPTHFAGLQVFLQAFMNQNTIVMGNNMKEYDIDNLIEEYNITKISATPSFYRYMSFDTKKIHLKVGNITLGGEKSDSKLVSQLKIKFPNAKINNVYASTEAGNLFASKGESFIIPDSIKGLVRIENKELLLHQDLMGEFDNSKLVGNWYYTGDIVELINENEIKFTNRIGDFINIGGYKANPVEIEEELMKLDNIVDALVYPRTNNVTGNIIAADIVINNPEEGIKKRIVEELRPKLQNWKIPRIIKVVDSIGKTNTGKKVRK